MSPFHRQTSRQVPDRSFGSIIRSLRLWHIYNASTHTPNHDNAPSRLSLHKMSSNTSGEEVGAVDIDTPELLHAVMRVRDGIKVFGKARAGNEAINLAMGTDDLGNGMVDAVGIGDVGVMGGHAWGTM